jgi:RNA-directed DNA polymerase
VNLDDATRQKSGQLELPLEGRGEAPRAERSGEASTAAHGNERSGADEARLMERVVERGNVILALKRVQKNKGSPGIDGMTVEDLPDHIRRACRRTSRRGTRTPRSGA